MISLSKKRKIHQILSFKNNQTFISVPYREGTISDSSKSEISDTFITVNEMRAVFFVDRLCSIEQRNISLYDESKYTGKENLMVIGGPLANKAALHLFQRFLSDLAFGVPENSKYVNKNNRKVLTSLVKVDESSEVGEIFIGDDSIFKFKRNEGGYICLIKLDGEIDFEDPTHGAVHIMFGNNAQTTLQAASFIENHYDYLIKKLKNTKRYFVLINCDNHLPKLHDFHDFTEYLGEE